MLMEKLDELAQVGQWWTESVRGDTNESPLTGSPEGEALWSPKAFFLPLLLACFTVCSLLVGPHPAHAADATELAGRIQKKYASINAFSANFKQAIRNAASGDTENRSGSFLFKKPVLVRWETLKPEKELLIVGKDAVWDYFEEDKEAYRYSVAEVISSKTMLRFLTGKANLTEDFLVAPGKPEEAGPGQAVLTLAPREPEPGLVLAKVWVDLATDMIARIFIQDFYANTNDLTLEGVAANPKLSDSLFAFTPPKDAKVHDNAPAKERNLKQ